MCDIEQRSILSVTLSYQLCWAFKHCRNVYVRVRHDVFFLDTCKVHCLISWLIIEQSFRWKEITFVIFPRCVRLEISKIRIGCWLTTIWFVFCNYLSSKNGKYFSSWQDSHFCRRVTSLARSIDLVKF